MKCAISIAALAAGLSWSSLAHAQFVQGGDAPALDQRAGQNVKDTAIEGRLTASMGYYGESGDPADASLDTLFWTDLRGRIFAEHIKGGKWEALGDFRIRYTPDGDFAAETAQTTSRGWAGGNEYDVRELYLARRGDKAVFGVGRLVLRDVDAMTIDGLVLGYRSSATLEYGLGAGMFPNPYSRSLDTDYKLPIADTRTITGYPVATGAWMGFRLPRFYGSVGAGAIFPRNNNAIGVIKEPNRTFVTTRGYARATPLINLFYYGVFDFTGAAGSQLTNLQVGMTWRVQPRLTLELGYGHLSTYAIDTYLRDYLETVAAPAAANSPANNLDVARMASDEGRVGANYAMLEKRVDIFGQLRYRRRDAIDTAQLDPKIAALPAEAQIDVSAGVRKKALLAGFDLGANAAYISGDRTKSLYAFLRANRTLLSERLDLDLDVGYISYEDACAPAVNGAFPNQTCEGTSKGSTIRAGFALVFRQSEKWLWLADYHYMTNSGTAGGMARPDVTAHIGMLRGQYSF